MDSLFIGVDVGSTTVKAVVVDPESKTILWQDYRRHHTRQAELVLEFLQRIQQDLVVQLSASTPRIFITGSGAAPLASLLGAKFVQEVIAVTMAAEHLHPDVGSVIELGGQDAKIIIFKTNPETGDRQSLSTMNDKCASGTGATIDKCLVKAGMPADSVSTLQFRGDNLHHVAAKCGVFAETDIVNLVKTGVPPEEIMCSLADAIVTQNLSVLARGNTLRHKVLLLGGPNTHLPFLQQCWRERIPQTWRERGYEYPKAQSVEELILVPENADLYAAYGAVLYGMHEPEPVGIYQGEEKLRQYIERGRNQQLSDSAGPPLIENQKELAIFSNRYRIQSFAPPVLSAGKTLTGFLGLDGGSTSSKCVVMDEDGNILLKTYRLSKGNPIQDMKDMLADLRQQVEMQGGRLKIVGFGVTGYAANVLESALCADVSIVETVAHMKSANHYFSDVDVICDIGGQDIKVLMLQQGELKNFRLSNQCSAGNGMLLQAMADQFGLPVTEYAHHAFQAGLSATFSYGCAVFLDSDRVNFQKEGYCKEELMAGLALVLPKNIWQYVVQIPRLSELGKRFVLQGGTQHNLAAVKAQVAYIKKRVPDAEVFVHPHSGEAGAIGAALEALRVVRRRGFSTFVGLSSAIDITYKSKNDASTQCHFCANHCSRTFIDTQTPSGLTARYISGFSCEKGTVEDKQSLKEMQQERKALIRQYPNLVQYEAKQCFRHSYDPTPLPESGSLINETVTVRGFRSLFGSTKWIQREFQRSGAEACELRRKVRIAMPKVLNMWSTGPFWRAYFETLGVAKNHIVFSDDTSESLFNAGGKYGAIDPCFPSKVVQAHIHNLLFHKHSESKPIDYLYFPTLTHIPSFVEYAKDTASCPIVAGTPNVIKAAFTKEVDFFAQQGICYIDDAVTMNEPTLLKQQLFNTWCDYLHITEDENDYAVDQGWKALDAFNQDLEEKGKLVIEQLERDGRIGILLLGRPYHNDPGINHEITEELQALGYPILSIRSIPKDPQWLHKYFAEDLEKGVIKTALDVRDVWPENYSANSGQKVWAAKFAARHPNIAVLDLSSFKCGNDAPTYGIVDKIIATAGVPYSALHDIDANKPSGSINIRVQTYAHSLSLREEKLQNSYLQQHREKQRALQKKLRILEDYQFKSGYEDKKISDAIDWIKEQLLDVEMKKQQSQFRDLSVDQFDFGNEQDSIIYRE